VVAGGEKRVVDRRVEASVSALPGSDGELDDAEEMGRGIDCARSVQFRELRVGPKARHDLLEAFELLDGSGERNVDAAVRGTDESLDLRAHRGGGAALAHDVLVITRGGSVTM